VAVDVLAPTRQRVSTRRLGGQGLVYLVLALGAAISIAPFYYVVRTSFESKRAYIEGTGGLSLSSWRSVLHTTPIFSEALHSVIVTLVSVALIVLISTLAGYGFAKLRPRFGGAAFTIIVVAFMIPVQSIVVPLYIDSSQLHIVGSYFGAIIVYTAIGLPFSVFLMTAFFQGVPNEIVEAALLDGLGYVGVGMRVLSRLAIPAMVTVGALQFIGIWNDLLIAMLWLPEPSHRLITVGLATLSVGQTVPTPVPWLMVAAIIQAIPAFIIFGFFQKYLVRGLTLGVGR
jgi:multiple sugar transport system permease protein/raffinose/stachyose/melibiose transport system permease protein